MFSILATSLTFSSLFQFTLSFLLLVCVCLLIVWQTFSKLFLLFENAIFQFYFQTPIRFSGGSSSVTFWMHYINEMNGFFGFFLFFSRNVLILKWRFILLDKIFNGRERWSPLTHGVCSPKKKCQNFWNMQTNNEILYTITRFMANQMVHIINPKKHRIFLGSSMFEWSRAFAIN